ncbi:SDR family NAD(P)-dependent oxidoreductase [Mucilaginibacter sp. OK283]|jgi:NADP-dependent 3-hydroxy acid dehydrogenase YdfG|uniref:SDR family NAD(P)-dependent oxidoreductase n=1 Tax=Mucilaginibacter sp. OK283 TaxID=1881049 RepID=UPI0008AE0685|nr:SDR family NAD(P)-dependent oxidoreductase [Mucilaginibacter sp. OK283]SEO71432.1 short chain dehydrogenase [Mucilaginibacter sp. OK283]
MNTLNQKIAIVAGADSGMGYATAKLFKAKDATVLVTGRNSSTINKVTSALAVTGYKSRHRDLNSRNSSFITGTKIPINDGLLVNPVVQ